LPTSDDNETIRIMNSTFFDGEDQLLIDEVTNKYSILKIINPFEVS